MRKDMLQQATKLNQKRKRRKGWKSLVRTLALGVVFCTTYVLILPAITMQEEAVCGYEAHTHAQECYSQPKAQFLGCGIPAEAIVVHQHSDLCRNEAGELICPLEETVVHSHGEDCYGLTEASTCPTHVHSEACVQTETALVCELPQSEGHAHSESCTGTQQVLICTEEIHAHGEGCYEVQPLVCQIPESEEHTHSESCTGTQSVLICTAEIHTHGDGCYEEQTLVCEIPEAEGHAHGEDCFTVTQIPCTEPTAQEHVHDETCQQQTKELTCTLPEIQLHSHTGECFDAEGTLTCVLPVVVEHIHSESCLVLPENTEAVLTCSLEEHVHDDSCYPLEEEPVLGPEYLCAAAVHTHTDTCYAEDGTVTCTIPEHTHEAACLVADLDLTADMEWPSQWKEKAEQLEFTGIWAEDLLTVAESQLGYAESKRNVILKNDQLLGYTRYADWYGKYYGEWDDMFVSFCLHYAEIPAEAVPQESDTAAWIQKLIQMDLYAAAGEYTSAAGDLIFWDSDDDGIADKSGIVSDVSQGQIKVIAGDTENNCVETLSFAAEDEAVLGYAKLPLNPLSPEEWSAAEAVSGMMVQLPEAETIRETLHKYNDEGDKAGYEALQQEVASCLETAQTAYDALNDAQKARITGLDRLDALKEVYGSESWKQFGTLKMDGAALTQLTAEGVQILPAAAEEEAEGTVRNGDTVRYTISAAAVSYDADVSYGEALVKFEVVLPLLRYKATFDVEAMPWLENSSKTMESRILNGTETSCQILTGYRKLTATDAEGIAVPGSFSEEIVVKVLDMEHGEELSLIVSAAMEHNTWEGVCEEHQTEEKLTVHTEAITVHAPLSEEEQQEVYEAFLKEYEQLLELEEDAQKTEAEALITEISEAYFGGRLAETAFDDLCDKVYTLIYGNLNAIAEPSRGTNWIKLRDSGWFEAYENAQQQNSRGLMFAAPRKASGAPMLTAGGTGGESDQQIRSEGGENSKDNVMVSKTIEGTDQENVFDITLQVVTQDVVTEIYKEPDMAVAIVMDISNTMREDFQGVSRYAAAMTAAEAFLDQFSKNNLGASNVGFIAFNSDAHEIFPMQACTTDTVTALKNEMRKDTGTIINASGYADSKKRFTNIEAGLKRAYDMLDTVDNEHKYIIFLSDGFPTTYIQSGYVGYDTYDASGTRFYDSVKVGSYTKRPCTHGTSYSDEAAIRARKMATTIKNNGATIFSIGVDIGGQTIQYYVDSFASSSFSVVDRRSTSYEIGSATSSSAYKNWLQNKIGSGEGYYFDSTNSAGLTNAFNSIFEKIKELNAESSHLDWVATDPMSDMGVHEVKAMEFIGFWDMDADGNWMLVEDDLTGVSMDGNLYDNTADFHEDTQTIHWDIKQSGYVTMATGGATNYLVELKYRVRLRNEESVFVERESYDTNDVTSLTYRIIEVTGGKTSISERRTIDFPIPAVEGYLAELSFQKLQPGGAPLDGAEFTLSHDTASCGYCRGDGKGHVSVPDQVAVSGTEGQVTFTDVPSGHAYTLTESKVPDGFVATEHTYKVVVTYDTLTVTVTDQDGNELEWTESITNGKYYVLPNTGGSGTPLCTFGGLLMMAAACVYLAIQFGRKRQRGGAYSR